jgi:hypothetical protein
MNFISSTLLTVERNQFRDIKICLQALRDRPCTGKACRIQRNRTVYSHNILSSFYVNFVTDLRITFLIRNNFIIK